MKKLLFVMMSLPVFAFADDTTPAEPGILDGIIEFVMGNFNSLSLTAQAIVLIILTVIAAAAHLAPYTRTTKDDFLVAHKNTFVSLVKKVFNLAAGNYRHAKNHDDAMAEKAAIKEAKRK